MSDSDRQKWNRKYASKSASSSTCPDEFLEEAVERLQHNSPDGRSVRRRAVDLACGSGHNSIWLARHGWAVDGVDISSTGLKLAGRLTAKHHTESAPAASPNWIEADLDHWQPENSAYDTAIVFRFLDRDSIPRIVHSALKPGGWLIYETFARAQLDRSDSHISNPEFTLASDELPDLFPEIEPIIHRVDVLPDRTVVRFLGRRRIHETT